MDPQIFWRVVRRIPRGKVATYGDVAAAAGRAGCARHVGRALRLLPDKTDVPWYRVVNAQGRISPRGDTASETEQRTRLQREGIPFRGDRIQLRECRWWDAP